MYSILSKHAIHIKQLSKNKFVCQIKILSTFYNIVRARHSFSPSVVFYYLTMAIADFISGCSYFYCVFAKETVPLWLGDPYPPKIATTYQLPTKVENLLYSDFL